MKALLLYSLILSAALMIMWGAYRLVRLGRKGRYALSRGVLLALVGFSVCVAALPFFLAEPETANIAGSMVPEAGHVSAVVTDGADAQAVADSEGGSAFSWLSVAIALFGAGALLSLVRTVMVIARIVRIIRRSQPEGNVRLHNDSRLVPFTWGRWVVMSRADYEANGPMLLAHENAHLHGAHWLDLLVLNIVEAFTWYCPATRLLRRDMLAAHEFVADSAVLSSGFSADDYQMLLISNASGRRFANSVTACINHSSLKTRITMMQNPNPAPGCRKRSLALIPAGLILLAMMASPSLSSAAARCLPAPEPAESETVVTVITADETPDVIEYYINGKRATTEEFGNLDRSTIESINVNKQVSPSRIDVITKSTDNKSKAEIPPSFPGGEPALYQFVAQHLKYPEECRDKQIRGRVVLTFEVKTDGTIGEVKVVKSAHPLLDAEAIRVVHLTSKWNPAKVDGKPVTVWYTMPFQFRLK